MPGQRGRLGTGVKAGESVRKCTHTLDWNEVKRYKSLFSDMWVVTLHLAQERAGQGERAGEDMGTWIPLGAGL